MLGGLLHRRGLLLVLLYGCIMIGVSKFVGWVDPDTKNEHRVVKSFTDGGIYELVMSDEFERAGRKFKNGEDPMWTGIDKSDDDQTSSGRKSLQFYNSSQIFTRNGHLVISTTTEDTKWKGWNPYEKKYEQMSRHFKSGMLQSWNKFCYTGGILEVNVQFPGRSDVGGLWPAIWLLGNLGRATFEASTNLMWPWSFPECSRDMQKAQEVSGCDVTSHYSLIPGQGRGATEIDLIEVMPGPSTKLPIVKNDVKRPYTSMTLQVAPGIPASKKRPAPGTLPEWGFHWYNNLTYGDDVSINPFFYGTYLGATKVEEPIFRAKEESYQCDAISSMMSLNDSYWKGMHKFRLEWVPGEHGYVHWYVDNKFRFGIEQDSLNEMKSKIPQEPSYVILNTAISTSWGFPNPPWGCTEYDCKDPEARCGFNPGFCQSLPAEFLIDYVRVYQNKRDPLQTLGCNPPKFPTRKFILAHEYRYKSLEDVHALKPVTAGGGKCSANSDCGTGTCSFKRCWCADDWTGPNCLVPSYCDTGADWERDWMTFAFPQVPPFLALCTVLMLGVLGATACLLIRRRRMAQGFAEVVDASTDKAPGWL